MKLFDINWNPDDRQLRQFGLICLPALPLAGWVCTAQAGLGASVANLLSGRWAQLAQDTGNGPLVGGLLAAGVVLAAVGLTRPQWLRWLFVALSLLTAPIGLAVSELVLVVIYFGVLTPLATVFRLVGRDALERKLEPHAATYWQPHPPTTDARRYFRQF